MAQVNFGKKIVSPKTKFFSDLEVNESFRVVSPASRGAIWRKVHHRDTDEYFQMEEATGKLYGPTHSPVEVVTVEVNIDAVKPSIYNQRR